MQTCSRYIVFNERLHLSYTHFKTLAQAVEARARAIFPFKKKYAGLQLEPRANFRELCLYYLMAYSTVFTTRTFLI